MHREDLELRVAGGRRLSVRVVGPRDGTLVVFHNGTPGSRYLFEGYFEACAERNLRLACYPRPGYDGSDRMPGRLMADGAADTAAVADALGADRFHVMGHSGGGAPALSDAAQLRSRVISAAALSGLAPRSAEGLDWRAGTEDVNGAEFAAIEAGDDALRRYLEQLADEFREIEMGSQLRAVFKESLCQADMDSLTGRFLEYQVASCGRAVQGGIWGWFDDDKAMWGDWGFDLAQISVPVSIWQGGKDGVVPAVHGRWLANHVPGARFHLLSEDGHLSILEQHFAAILDELITLGTSRG